MNVSALPSLDGWAMLSQPQRNASFDNNAAVANSADLVAARNAAASAYRKAHPGHLDLAYGSAPRQKLDLFPAADARAPCFFFIHGGYWQRNGREDFSHVAHGVNAHGWSAALPSHTLAPDATLTQIVAEIRMALDWLGENGASHEIAPRKLVLGGWSAGGHLAAMALDHPLVAAGIVVSGVYELGPVRDTGFNEKLALTDKELETLSPLRLPVVSKPLTISFGTRELPAFHDNPRALFQKRIAVHAPTYLAPVAGADHFTILDAMTHPEGELVRATLALG